MIAANYRKFPEAMALQLVLLFGRCTWHTSRPTQRGARAVRAARGELVKITPQVVRWVKKATPEWFKQAKRKARDLANQVRAAIDVFVWDLEEELESDDPENDHFTTEWSKRFKKIETQDSKFGLLLQRPGGMWRTVNHFLPAAWWFQVAERSN